MFFFQIYKFCGKKTVFWSFGLCMSKKCRIFAKNFVLRYMINRIMVRTKVLQTLFAYYQGGEKTSLTAKNELLKSYADTYDLYVMLLDFVNELTAYAEQQIEQAEQRAKVTHTLYIPNRRFVKNRFAQQIFENRAIRKRMDEEHLGWDTGMSAVAAVYKQLVEQDFYKEYMALREWGYEEDKAVWRQIFTNLLFENSALTEALEEMEIALDKTNWADDQDMMLAAALKTVRSFREITAYTKDLSPMFDDEEEAQFGERLLQYALEGHAEYEELINANLKNWDAERIAAMDRIIIEQALAEIIHFDEIPLQVSLNEYIELAKEYSGEKSYLFVNGILNEILRKMKREGTLLKAEGLK